jgi:hypothetical protein
MFSLSLWQNLRGRRMLVVGTVSFVLGLCMMAQACGAEPIVRVEEEWELVVTTPDIGSNAPQVTCAMTPYARLDWLHMTFEINHRSDLDYVAGGLNVLVWQGERHLATKSSPDTRALATTGETIRWTQAMEVRDGQITFEVIRGDSTTWGSFGDSGCLKASVAVPLSDLSGYNPDVSVRHSGVTFASSCVNKLTLKSVRYYRADGTVQVDATPRVVLESTPVAP